MKLYNESVKNDFIKQYGKMNERNTINIFERITPKEEKLDKDLYDFSVAEIIEFYKATGVASADILYCMNNLFQRYTSWALAKQMVRDGQNHYDELSDYSIFLQLINPIKLDSQFITRKVLLNDCEDMCAYNPVYAFVALGLYEGIGSDKKERGNEFVGLTMDSFKDGVVTLPSGRKLEVSKELIKYAELAANTYDITPFDSEKGIWRPYEGTPTVFYDENDNNILKRTNNIRSEDLDGVRKIRMMTMRLKIIYGRDVYAPKAMVRAGLVNYIKTLAKGRTDFIAVITENYEKIVYRYGDVPNITKFVNKYRRYLESCE